MMLDAPVNTVPVTVVVCARNREQVISRCLDSIRDANPDEVIVVDGNSTDKTVDIVRAKGMDVVSDEGKGLGVARQLGAQLASNDYIVFVDTDTVVLPDTLSKLLEEAQAENYDALQAELRTLSEKPTYWQEAEAWRRRVQMRKGLTNLMGCQATLLRRDLVMKIGFDPVFSGSAEDADFCLRARASGARIAHSLTAVAYHDDRQSFAQFIKQRLWYGQGLARMLLRHGSRYTTRAAEQVQSARNAARVNFKYLPYICVSWSMVTLGTGIEMLRLARNPSQRQRFRAGSTRAFG